MFVSITQKVIKKSVQWSFHSEVSSVWKNSIVHSFIRWFINEFLVEQWYDGTYAVRQYANFSYARTVDPSSSFPTSGWVYVNSLNLYRYLFNSLEFFANFFQVSRMNKLNFQLMDQNMHTLPKFVKWTLLLIQWSIFAKTCGSAGKLTLLVWMQVLVMVSMISKLILHWRISANAKTMYASIYFFFN